MKLNRVKKRNVDAMSSNVNTCTSPDSQRTAPVPGIWRRVSTPKLNWRNAAAMRTPSVWYTPESTVFCRRMNAPSRRSSSPSHMIDRMS